MWVNTTPVERLTFASLIHTHGFGVWPDLYNILNTFDRATINTSNDNMVKVWEGEIYVYECWSEDIFSTIDINTL